MSSFSQVICSLSLDGVGTLDTVSVSGVGDTLLEVCPLGIFGSGFVADIDNEILSPQSDLWLCLLGICQKEALLLDSVDLVQA